MRFMKKSLMKKAFSALTAIMTTTTMAASLNVFAANTDDHNTGHAHLIPSSADAIIPIKKDIVPFNPDEKAIYEPNIVYTYEISSANAADAKIRTVDTSDQPIVIDVHNGVLAAIQGIGDSGDSNSHAVDGTDKKTGTITFGLDNSIKKSSNKETADTYIVSDGYKFTQQMNISIDADYIYNPETGETGADKQVNPPGVYRYKIEDVTAATAFTNSGVEDGHAGNLLYLDVYTKYNTAQDGLVIYGYVLFREDTTQDSTNIEYSEKVTDAEEIKTEGFVTSSEGDDDGNDTLVDLDDATFDKYKTYNVEVEKKVAGDLADRQHQFPFTIQLSNDTVTSQADFSIMKNAGTTNRHALDATGSCISDDFKLKHGESVTLIGLPSGTNILVTEENDTDDVYTASAKINNTATQLIKDADDTTAAASVAIGKNSTASLSAEYEFNKDTAADVITFTNTLSDVSVTGLLFSIAPFIFITLTGAVLFVFVMKRRNHKKDENII
jgi:hypothetical protein